MQVTYQMLIKIMNIESLSLSFFGRLITDNVIIAFEVLHIMTNKQGGKQGSMALKLDMAKAYNRGE